LNGDLMRPILAALFVCLSVPAFAIGWNGPWNGIGLLNNASEVAMHVPGDWDHVVRVANPVTGGPRRVLSRECRVASSLGGPCGCWTSEYFFGHSVRDLWLANEWLKFPRTEPQAGVAAVWPGRHVAPVVANNGDGTITVADSWATHRVRTAGLVFVDPKPPVPF
jgi:hypothetical protein